MVMVVVMLVVVVVVTLPMSMAMVFVIFGFRKKIAKALEKIRCYCYRLNVGCHLLYCYR
jgi:hypothetical protein